MQKTKTEPRIRALEEQFPKQTVRRIRAIQADLASLRLLLLHGAGRFYAKELERCLEAGLLLASLHLATSFLELFVRDLLIYVDARDSDLKNERSERVLDNLEKYYEDATKPQWSFSKIVDELQKRGTIDTEDTSNIKDYYERIRIPIHHGLTRRFLRGERDADSESDSLDIFDMLFLGRSLRAGILEERLEDETVDLVEIAIAFVRKYAAHLAANQVAR